MHNGYDAGQSQKDYPPLMTPEAELTLYQRLCGSDADKLAALEGYVSLPAARDEDIDDGEPTESLNAQVSAARAELRYQLCL
jgi:hypothetical protein